MSNLDMKSTPKKKRRLGSRTYVPKSANNLSNRTVGSAVFKGKTA